MTAKGYINVYNLVACIEMSLDIKKHPAPQAARCLMSVICVALTHTIDKCLLWRILQSPEQVAFHIM